MDMKQKFAKPLAVLLSAGLIAGSVGATERGPLYLASIP